MDQVLRQLHLLAQAHASREHKLSQDEVHVLARIANGATNEEIASDSGSIGVSERSSARSKRSRSSWVRATGGRRSLLPSRKD